MARVAAVGAVWLDGTIMAKASKRKYVKKNIEEKLRDDGRIPTTLYILPEILADAQAIAKADVRPTYLFIENAVLKAINAHRKK